MIKAFGRTIWAFLTDSWCRHEWEILREYVIWKDQFWGTEHLVPSERDRQPDDNFARKGRVYHKRCVHCGELQQERISI